MTIPTDRDADQQFPEEAFRSIPSSVRPKLRWTWPGVAVEDRELIAEVREMAAAGYGGTEISNMAMGLPATGNPPETSAWASDHWVDRIRTALLAGQEADFGVDLTIGPGWPWVSPAVSGDNIDLSQQELLRAEQSVVGPIHFISAPPEPPNLESGLSQLVAVTAARTVAGSQDMPVLLDPATTVDLTSQIGKDGQLRWDAPSGKWILFGFWRQPTRQHARGVLPDDPLAIKARGESPSACTHLLVVDHMRRESAEAALKYLDARIDKLGAACAHLGELFEDSLELEARGLFWTPDFSAEFRSRRGYSLERYLPVIHRRDISIGEAVVDAIEHRGAPETLYDFPGEDGERVRRDYHQTLTDLWIDGHLAPMRTWANERGLATRVQVYGNTFDNIAAAKAVDIPETEDLYSCTVDFWRTIASGAHLSGATKVSMEHTAVMNADFMMTLRELKRRADKAFAAGVNQLVTHVYPYRHALGERWPCWTPWSSPDLLGGELGFSEAWNGTNPQWRHIRPLADYFARAQALLRAGRPVADVAVYRDVYGYPAEHGNIGTIVPLGVDAPEPALNIALTSAGMSFDFINPATLVEASTIVEDRRLVVQEPGYQALVIDLASSMRGVVNNSSAMGGSVARRLAEMADMGLPIVFVGSFPVRGVSYRSAAEEDAEVREAVAELERLPNVRLANAANEIPSLLSELGVSAALAFDAPQDVYNVHRTTVHSDYWFLWNAGDREAEFVASFETESPAAPQLWDLWTGEVHDVGLYESLGDRIQVPLTLGPRETVVISFIKEMRDHVISTNADEVVVKQGKIWLRSSRGGMFEALMSDGSRRKLRFDPIPPTLELRVWGLEVDGVVPTGTDHHRVQLSELADWRMIEQIEDSSGIGTYTTQVDLDPEWVREGRGAYLQLGIVHGGVQVRVNEKLVAPACVPPWRLDVGPYLKDGTNTIEVELSTTLKNRVNSLADRSGFEYLASRPERTQAYGLLGPVRLIAYADELVRTR